MTYSSLVIIKLLLRDVKLDLWSICIFFFFDILSKIGRVLIELMPTYAWVINLIIYNNKLIEPPKYWVSQTWLEYLTRFNNVLEVGFFFFFLFLLLIRVISNKFTTNRTRVEQSSVSHFNTTSYVI